MSGRASTEGSVGTGLAAVAVVGRNEVAGGIEHLLDLLCEQLDEMVTLRGGHIRYGRLAETQDGVVVLHAGVLDEEQGGSDFRVRGFTPN